MAGLDTRALQAHARRVHDINRRLEELEEEQNALKIERWRLVTGDIPAILIEYGQRDCTLQDGTEISVLDEVQGSFPKDVQKAADALRYLRSNGYGDIIRNSVTGLFKNGQDALAADFEQQLLKTGITMERRQTVNHQTFLAWARRLLKEGEIIDLEKVGLSQVRTAKLKFKKDDDHG